MNKKMTVSIGLWVLLGLVAVIFLFAGFAKVTSQPMMVAEFDQVGLGQWFRYFTGTLEIIGAIGVLWPRFSPFAACLLLLVDAGAFAAQVAILHMDWIHTIVIALILGGIIYLQRYVLAGSRYTHA